MKEVHERIHKYTILLLKNIIDMMQRTYNNNRPATFTVSLGGLFFAFPEQIFFVAVHLVLFFFGQALALDAGFVGGIVIGQT